MFSRISLREKVSNLNRIMVNQLVNPLILEGKIVMGRRVFPS